MKKPSKKVLLIGLVVIVAGAAGAAYWLLNRDTEAEAKNYATLQTATVNLRKSYDKLEKTFNAYVDEAQTAEEKTALDKAHDDYQAKLTAYKDKIEAADDGKIDAAYETFASKSDTFEGYVTGYVEDFAATQTLKNAECISFDFAKATSADANVVNVFDKAVQACQVDLAKLKNSTNEGLAAYGEKLDKYFEDRRAKLNGLQQLAATANAQDLQEAFVAFMIIEPPDITKELAKARETAAVVKHFEELSKIVAEKAAGAEARDK